jgi:DNA-binding NtrC family response regulator
MVVVDCGSLPPTLIQSELFGYEKGAFTGAQQPHKGHIEAATGGTLFLDEIGELPRDLQVNLLRFLQEKTINRLGSARKIPVDVRVIAATHVNLEKAVREGRFREDLYYRLNVIHFSVPALRERDGDIELLADFYFRKFSSEAKFSAKGYSLAALQAMRNHAWPGNVRELINRIRQALVMCENGLIRPNDLGLGAVGIAHKRVPLDDARAAAEKCAIEACLSSARHNVSQAARELGVSRVTLYRLMEKYAIGGLN